MEIRTFTRFIAALLLLLASLGLTTQAQTTRYVSTTGINANPASATSWATSTTDLQGAINASSATDQVWVASGTYKPTTVSTDRTISFAMKNGVAIYGGFAESETTLTGPAGRTLTYPSSTTLSGDIDNTPGSNTGNSLHVISNPVGLTTTAILDGFVITGGNANGGGIDAFGGGMFNDGRSNGNVCSPSLINCSFQGNTATGVGGAMMNDGISGTSSPSLTNCSFQNNTAADRGGAMFNSAVFSGISSPSLTNCSFQNNRASGQDGGAMYNNQTGNTITSPSLTNCSFQGNTAINAGGAMINFGTSSPSLTNCSFQGNTASAGGAMINFGINSPSLTNCSFQGNGANGGGVMFNFNSSPSLTNCVLFGNGDGNTITNVNGSTLTAAYSLFDQTVTGYTSGPGNLTTTTNPFISTASTQLNACSPAINAGNDVAYTAANGPTTDLAGNPRVFGGIIDMGAVEFQAAPIPRTGITAQPVAGSAVCAGSAVSVPVSVSGTGPFTYQWYKDNLNSAVTGQTTSTLSLSNLTLASAGSYSVVVTGSCNSVTSTAFSLTINAPARLYVDASKTSGQNTGLDWTNAFIDLQSALQYSCSQNLTEVWVARGTYKPTTTTIRTISFAMKNGVAIYGGFVGTETALSQRPAINPVSGSPSSSTLSGDIGAVGSNTDNSLHVISNPVGLTTTAILDGFVITGGNANGGGIDAFGGGMFNDGRNGNVCSPSLINCSFQGNTATGVGGAMMNDGINGTSSPSLTNCSFQNNTAADRGGAMFNSAVSSGISSPSLTNCSFQGNTATSGGAMYNFGQSGNSSPSLTNCSFQGNTASLGGAMYNFGLAGISSPSLTNCSFQGNTAATSGGAMYNFNSSPSLTNCVLFGNGDGNTISNVSSTLTAAYSLFDQTVTGYTSGLGNLTTTTNPFASTSSVALTGCALAINAGNDAAYTAANGPTTDLAGNPRVFGGIIDMGAVEFQATPIPRTGITAQPVAGSGVCVSGTVTAMISVSGTGPFTYQWYKNNVNSPVSGQISATLTLSNVQSSDAGSYSVVVTGSCNSVTSTAFSLTVNTSPTNASLTSGTLTCSATSATLTASATGGVSYSFSAGAVQIGTTNQAVVSTAGDYSVIIANATGCTATATATVGTNTTAPAGPTLSASNSGTLTCSVTSLTLTAATTSSGSFTYAFGGPSGPVGAASNSNMATVSAPGVYTVTITGSNGCTATATTEVFSNTTAPTNASLTSGTLTCSQTSVTLTASATGGASYTLSDGQTNSTGQFVVSTPGDYTVVISSANGCTATATTTVSSNTTAPSIASFGTSQTLTCTQTTVSLTANATGQGALSYAFSGPGIVSQSGNVLSVSASGTYSVTVTDVLNSCSAVSTTMVNQPAAALAIAQSGSTTNVSCNGGSNGAIAVIVSGGTASYTISAGGSFSTVLTAAGTASLTGLPQGTYTVEVKDANGCVITTAGISVTEPSPGLSITQQFNPASICAGQSSTLTATPLGGKGPYTFTFTPASGLASSGMSNTLNVMTTSSLINSTVSYTVTITDANGCTAVSGANFDLTVNALPTVTITPASTAICNGQSVDLTAMGGTGYVWNDNSTNAQRTVTPSVGTTSYTVTATNVNGCSNTATATVTVNPLPTATLVASNGGVITCTTPVTLTAGGGTSFTFVNPAGAIAGTPGSASTLTVNAPGTYSVTVANANGCISTTFITITQDNTLPTVGVTASSLTVTCTNPVVTLTASGADTYTFSAGAGSTGVNSATVNTPGTYTITGATTVNGCSSQTMITIDRDANLPGTLVLTPSNSGTLTCAITSLSLTASGVSGTGLTYAFSGPGFTQSGSLSVASPISVSGTYSVTVTAANGCSATTSTQVFSNTMAPALASFGTSQTLTCAQPIVSVTAVATGQGVLSYAFSGPGIVSQSSISNIVSVSASGTYSVTVTDAVNGCFTSTITTVTDNLTQPAGAGLTASDSGTLTCAVTTLTLSASTSSAGSFTYAFSGGAGQIGATNSATVNAQGTYSVVITSANGCTSSASVTVFQNVANPVVTLGASNSINCTIGTATLSATATGSIAYTYAFSGPSGSLGAPGSSSTGVATAAGTYTVVVTGANGCTVSNTTTVLSDTALPGNPTLSASNSNTITCSVRTLTLTVGTSSVGSFTYTFSGPGLAQTSTVNTATVNQQGTYTVVITNANNCSAVQTTEVFSNTTAPANASLTSGTLTCLATSVTLTASSTGGASYTFSAGAVQIGTTNQAVVSAAGTYSVIIANATGCTATATAMVGTNTTTPTLTVSPGSGTLTCSVTSLTLTASGSGTSYVWTGGTTGATLPVSASGTYSVTGTAANGCTSTTSVTIYQNAPSGSTGISPIAASSVVCEGTNVVVPATTLVPAGGYQWYKDGTAVAGQTSATLSLGGVVPAQAGSYVLALTGACSSTSNAFVLTVNPLPVVTLVFPTGSIVSSSNPPVITLPDPLPVGSSLNFGVQGAVSYERRVILDRINGYEIRQVDYSRSGFPITRTGLFSVTGTDGQGCQRTVQGIIANLPGR